jgi:pSer/pThr/pTyr-binding forkhead associated (FHA) protein
MGVSSNDPAPEDTPELAEAKRCGDPYLVYRDAHSRQRVLSLSDTWDRITIGRAMGADVALTWDRDVSRVHAELTRLADDWTVIDDGLSRNGTFVNDQRVEGRRRLFDGDVLRCGRTSMLFHSPFQAADPTRSTRTLP